MNKRELIAEINKIKPSLYYSSTRNSYDIESGFSDCRSQIINLVEQLDEQGLTFEAYNMFRQQTNDMINLYKDLLDTQAELFSAKKELLEVQAKHWREAVELTDSNKKAVFYFIMKLFECDQVTPGLRQTIDEIFKDLYRESLRVE